MYIPEEFEWNDRAEVIAFMRQYNFATIVTAAGIEPRATHLPFHILERGDELFLTAHLAKANPQCGELGQALVIFQGPHAYISPKDYDPKREEVPTWNYLAVHASGVCRVVTDDAEGWHILEDMMRQSEPAYMEKWATLSADYKNRLFRGIVPFEMKIDKLLAARKASQDKSKMVRAKIAETLANASDGAANDLATFMDPSDTV